MKSAFVLAVWLGLGLLPALRGGPLPYDTAPQRLTGAMPSVPGYVNGYVALIVDVDSDGQVAAVSIKEATDPKLAALCARSARDWHFAPAFKAGVAVPTTVIQPFRFGTGPLPPIDRASFADPQLDEAKYDIAPDDEPLPPSPTPAPQPTPAPEPNPGPPPAEPSPTPAPIPPSPLPIPSAAPSPLPTPVAPLPASVEPTMDKAPSPAPASSTAPKPEATVEPNPAPPAAPKPDVAVNRLPSIRRTVTPQLPAAVREQKATVSVLFRVKPSGEVASVEVRDQADPQLAEPILAAARRWSFKPALKEGKPVSSRVLVPFLVGSE